MRVHLLTGLLALLSAGTALAEVQTRTVTYEHGGQTLKGFLAWDDAAQGQRPGVLVVHEWWGLNDYARDRARQLAEMGYVAFAADMYGEGKTTDHPATAKEWATTIRMNEAAWRERVQAALKILRDDDKVDGQKLAAIGYCFGGSTALQLAYTGAPLKAVATFHAALPLPSAEQAKDIKAKILVCHGALDTFIPEEAAQKFRAALDEADVDYEMAYYGNAVHSFTVPDADKHGNPGMRYNAEADRRSWRQMRALFREAFGEQKGKKE